MYYNIERVQWVWVHRLQYQTYFKEYKLCIEYYMFTHSMVTTANNIQFVYVIQPLYILYVQ